MKKINILGVGNALVDKQFLIEDSFLDDISIDKGTMGLCESNYQEELYKKLSKHHCLRLLPSETSITSI